MWPMPGCGATDLSSTYRDNLLDGTFPKALAMFKTGLRLRPLPEQQRVDVAVGAL